MVYYYSFKSSKYVAYTNDGEYYYSPGGEYIGYLNGNYIYSQSGKVIGYFDNNKNSLYSQDGQPLWYKG